jgi:DNA-binding response OmpR family regulator
MARILLIEPDLVLAKSYAQALRSAGHQVSAASGAQTGIMAADTASPDLVVLELQLVEHSGIEFLYEFRSYPDWQNIPVVVQTCVPRSEFIDNWQLLRRELGVQAYLYKPRTSLRRLLSAVHEHLPVAA